MTSHLAPLLALKAKVLKSLAASIGVSSVGTKPQLAARIAMSCYGLFDRSGEMMREDCGECQEREVKQEVRGWPKKRVLSIDMGIRNLAMCVIEVPAVVNRKKRSRPTKKSIAETLPKVIAWERITVAQRPPKEPERPEIQAPQTDSVNPKKGKRKTSSIGFDESVNPLPSTSGSDTTAPKKGRRKTPSPDYQEIAQTLDTDVTAPKKGRPEASGPDSHGKKKRKKAKTPDAKESFEPADYSILTTNFVRTVLSRFSPDAILIERQRYRSCGASSVLEWVIRVNMFEAMMHAVFYCLGNSKRGDSAGRESPAAESVRPDRVNKFWIDKLDEKHLKVKKRPSRKKRDPDLGGDSLGELDEGMSTKVKKTSAKMKLAKISLVSKWIKSGDVVSLGKGVASTASGFVPPGRVGGKRGPKKGKLDDLADCLLQGMAWIRWEENRRSLAEGRLIPEFSPGGKKEP